MSLVEALLANRRRVHFELNVSKHDGVYTRQLQKKYLKDPIWPDTPGVSGPVWRVAHVHHL